jgi:hypothetical protein
MQFRLASAFVAIVFLMSAAPAISGAPPATGFIFGDFDGDGDSDLVFKDPIGGGVDFWELENRAFVRRSGFLGGTDFKIVTVGKLNADDVDDLVIYNPTNGQVAVWYLTQNPTTLGVEILGFKVLIFNAGPNAPAGSGDWNADGNLDLVLFDPATRNLSISLLDADNVLISTTFVGQIGGLADPTGSLLVTGNFDNDSIPDIAQSLSGATQVGFWKMGGTDGTTIQRGSGFNLAGGTALIASAADMDGNGTDDFMSHATVSGENRAFFVSNAEGFLGVLSGNQFTGINTATLPYSFGEFTSGGGGANPDLLLQDPVNQNVAVWELTVGVLGATGFVGTPGAGYVLALLGE